MEQATFAELEHDAKKRGTRRELFPARMDRLIPWDRLERRIEPFRPKPGRGRRQHPLRALLRVHCARLFQDLSDPGMEDLLREAGSARRFAGLRLTGPLPDGTTMLGFRHLPEGRGLGEAPFAKINAHLASLGHRLKRGTIVDAGIIDAPSSTGNKAGGAGSGDASSGEGRPMALRDEGAPRRGLGDGPDAQPGDGLGERGRRGRGARGASRCCSASPIRSPPAAMRPQSVRDPQRAAMGHPEPPAATDSGQPLQPKRILPRLVMPAKSKGSKPTATWGQMPPCSDLP